MVAAGDLEEVLAARGSVTASYMRGDSAIELPAERRTPDTSRAIVVRGARANNLKGITASFPLNAFVCVSGVSGSGKSSLVTEILHKGLRRRLYRSRVKPGPHDAIAARGLRLSG